MRPALPSSDALSVLSTTLPYPTRSLLGWVARVRHRPICRLWSAVESWQQAIEVTRLLLELLVDSV